jgi:TP901 family phage tail tape measure protein
MATADTARLVAELGLKDKLSAGLDKAIGKVGKFESRIDRLGAHVSRGLGSAARNTERAIVVGLTGAAAGLTYAVKQATDAESAIAGIAKTVNGDISSVVDGLKNLSNTIPVSFGELAGIAELGGAMGIAKADLVEFTRQVAILGTTTNVSVEDAATALGQMANVIGLTGKEFDNFAAALVDLGNKGSSTEAQILEIARRSGGAAKLIGVAKDATLGWAAAAANLGLNEELAGTALQRFFVTSQTLISAGGADLRTFAKISGKTAAQFKKAFAKDATGALTDFLEGLGEMSKGKRIAAVQDLFGKGTGLTRLILGLSDSIDKNLTPSLNTSTTAWEQATAAQVEADKRFATSASNFKTLRNNIDNAAATIGANLLPVLVELSKEATTWLADPKTQAAIKTFGKDLAVGAREAVKWLKSLDWNAIGNSLKTAAGFGKGLVDAFLAAPPWLQQFLTAGFVANKFTGGAIGGIIGELGKGLVKGVLGMNAGVVNINAGVVNGGGVPGGKAGKPGGIPGILSLAVPLAAIAASIGPDPGGSSSNADVAQQIFTLKRTIEDTSRKNANEISANGRETNRELIARLTERLRALEGAADQTNTALNKYQTAASIGLRKAADASTAAGIESGLKAKNAGDLTKAQIASSAMIEQAMLGAQMATTRVTASATQGTVRGVAPPIVSAIRANRPQTYVTVNIQATHVTKAVTIQNRYGPGNGSSGSDNIRGGAS